MFLLGQGETGRTTRRGERFYTDSFSSCIWVVMRHAHNKQSATHLDWPADVTGFLAREQAWFKRPMQELYLFIYHRPAVDGTRQERFGAKDLAETLKAAFLRAGGRGDRVGLFTVPEDQYGITSEGRQLTKGERVSASPFLSERAVNAGTNYKDQTRVRRMRKALEPNCLPLIVFDDHFIKTHHTLPEWVREVAAIGSSSEEKEAALAERYEGAWRALLQGDHEAEYRQQAVAQALRPQTLLQVWDVFSREATVFYHGYGLLDPQALVAAYDRHLAALPSEAGERVDYDESWVRPSRVCGVSPCCALAFAATAIVTVVGAAAAWWPLNEPEMP